MIPGPQGLKGPPEWLGRSLQAAAGHPEDALGIEKKEWKIHSKRQLVEASPFEAIVALMKADVSPVVTAGTIKPRVSSSIPKDT